MKRFYTLFGLLLFGLLLHSGLADISLTLRGVSDDQSYLPPPIQDVPVNEEHFNVKDTASQQHHSFEESNFGDSHYQIFEVHNHFAPSSNQQAQQLQQQLHRPATQSNYEAQGYLPPKTQEIHIQHVNQAQDTNDNNLDVSFLSFAAGESTDGQQVTISENVPRAAVTSSLPVSFPSSYQHESQTTKVRSGKLIEEGVFGGPDYLPPNRKPSTSTQEIRIEHVYPSHASINQQLSDPRQSNFRASEYLPPSGAEAKAEFRGPDYLPPHRDPHHHSNNEVQNEQRFKGPDYLPPLKSTKAQTHERHLSEHTKQVGTSAGASQVYRAPDYLPPQTGGRGNHHQPAGLTSFKGPDYLPPHRKSFKGPDYLPPHAEAPQQHRVSQNNYKGPDYLPPHAEVTQQHHSSQNNYNGPDYLPPHAEAPQQHHSSQNNYNGPDYLPPHQEHSVAIGPTNYKGPNYLPPHHEHSVSGGQKEYKGPDYLPPHNSDAEHRAPGHLPPGYDFTNPEEKQVQQHAFQATPTHVEPTLQVQELLPSGYDFTKPPNSEQAIALLHSQPSSSPAEEQHPQHQEVVVGTQIEVSEREQVPGIIYGRSHQSGADVASHFNGHAAEKSVPIAAAQPQTNNQVQQGDVQAKSNYNGIEQTIPSAEPVEQQYSAPDYLPPTVATSAQQHQEQYSHMNSLSSYMTAVQPFGQRYGDTQFTEPRKPFAQYGPPPAQHAVLSQPIAQQAATGVDVAPMHSEQAKRSQYYAPGMSYGANAYTGHQQQSFRDPTPFSFSEQTKQTLQGLMPKDIKIQSQIATTAQAPTTAGAAVPTAAFPTTGKIRTVQIINPNAVKTLKVLETTDLAGVKTIKILGASNENPTGEHHIVKVVSQTLQNGINENHVQTVKIYNDQQEVSIPLAASSATYLPPTAAASAKVKRSVRVPRQSSPSTPENKESGGSSNENSNSSNNKRRRRSAGKGRHRY